jgi:hypothetical protein
MAAVEATKAGAPPRQSLGAILAKASKRALGGGLPGFCAMIIQVVTLMWMRTLVNYQYSRGGSFGAAFNKLYAEGGIPRFYNGFWAAIIVGPLSRFGDTAANEGILALCEGVLPTAISTIIASAGAACWRIMTQPVQNVKTLMQVEGAAGLGIMLTKVGAGGAGVLWEGALGTMSATWLGHYPWFLTYNQLNAIVPDSYTGMAKLGRNASIGFCASFVSDCVSNGIRVITTAKQTAAVSVGYMATAKGIIATDGLWGLLGRGLGTKIVSNGLSAMLFSVLWRYLQQKMRERGNKSEKTA